MIEALSYKPDMFFDPRTPPIALMLSNGKKGMRVCNDLIGDVQYHNYFSQGDCYELDLIGY